MCAELYVAVPLTSTSLVRTKASNFRRHAAPELCVVGLQKVELDSRLQFQRANGV